MILIIVQSTIIISLALCIAGVLRKQSAATRHAILSAGLVSSIILPFAIDSLPRSKSSSGQGLYIRVQKQAGAFWTSDNHVMLPPAAARVPARTLNHLFGWIWFGGTAIAGIVLLFGAVRIVRLSSRARSLGSIRWTGAAHEIAARLRIKRPSRLLQTEYGVLGTWGIMRPRIFLPKDAVDWSDQRVRVVLTHEFAHIQRFDWPVQILAELARGLYWFNPLFWFACRWLRLESEHACDDVVLNAGFDPKDYAAHLLELARALRSSDGAWSTVLAMARLPNLERRFIAMLNPSVNRGSASRATMVALGTVALCMTLPIAAMRPPAAVRQNISMLPAKFAAPSVPVSGGKPGTAPPSPVVVKKTVISAKPAPPAPQQAVANGRLVGTIYDSTGAVVPGVRITVSVRGTTFDSTVSNETGSFEFRTLPEGRYSLAAELPGFMPFRSSLIDVKSNESVVQNVFLSVSTVSQRVEVTAAGRRRPPVPAAVPQRIRVGGNVIAANLISQVKPVYPQTARDAGIEGLVHLQGIIGTDGVFMMLRVVSSNNADLAAAALEAVKQWRYRPTLLNNQPIEVLTDVEVAFSLAE